MLWPTLPVLPHTTLFRRTDGERIGWFDETFRYAAEDKDFFARLAKLGPVVYVPEVVSLVRRGHASLTRNSMRTEYWAMHLYRKHLDELRREGGQTAALQRRLQWRIGLSLQRIAAHRSAGIELPDYMPADYVRQWLPLTGVRDRINYRWQTWLRQPLRRLIKGPN